MATMISKRGKNALAPNVMFDLLDCVFCNLYEPSTNKAGIISLGVAENFLCHEELVTFMNQQTVVNSRALTYGSGFTGDIDLRDALALFYNKHFKAHIPLDRHNVVVTCGTTATLDMIAFALCDPGDGVLIGRPMYGGFGNDLMGRANAVPIGVNLQGVDPMGPGAIELFEAAIANSKIPVRALILCHPQNPLGKCYTKEVLIEYMRFCQRHEIHLISDEIYAMSVFTSKNCPDAVPFTSVLEIDMGADIIDRNLVHVVHGASKDFCANGLRIGTLVSYSIQVIKAVAMVDMFSTASSVAQNFWLKILTTPSFLDRFLTLNAQRLGEAYDRCASALEHHKIPYIKGGNAGFFIWLDLTSFLPSKAELGAIATEMDREHALTRRLLDAGVYLATGEAFCSESPGWYRITFTVPSSMLDMGLERLIGVSQIHQ